MRDSVLSPSTLELVPMPRFLSTPPATAKCGHAHHSFHCSRFAGTVYVCKLWWPYSLSQNLGHTASQDDCTYGYTGHNISFPENLRHMVSICTASMASHCLFIDAFLVTWICNNSNVIFIASLSGPFHLGKIFIISAYGKMTSQFSVQPYIISYISWIWCSLVNIVSSILGICVLSRLKKKRRRRKRKKAVCIHLFWKCLWRRLCDGEPMWEMISGEACGEGKL